MYKTTNLQLAAVLICEGLQPSGVFVSPLGTGEFKFEEDERIQVLENDFLNGRTRVEPRDFVTAMRTLKKAVQMRIDINFRK